MNADAEHRPATVNPSPDATIAAAADVQNNVSMEGTGAKKPGNPSPRSTRFIRLVLYLMLINSLWLLAIQHYFPQVIQELVVRLTKPAVVAPLGRVTAVHYIGGIGTKTQVDTEKGSMLLYGIVNLEQGTELEAHIDGDDVQVCEVGTTRCAYRLGDAK